MKHGSEIAVLRGQAARLGVALDENQIDRLLRYERLLGTRAVEMGLIAEGDAHQIRQRHLLDCLRAAPLTAGAADVVDLGSGAGLPGLVIAVARPDLRVGLVDSRQRRIAFLELAIEELELTNATPHAARAESLTTPVDVCLARAFAPAARAWEIGSRLLRPGGRLVYFAGRGRDPEAAIGGLPSDARILDVLDTPVLESAGPLVIMARQ